MRRNLNRSVSGKRICGTPKTGVIGSQIPSDGDHGAGYAYASLSLPADAGLEIAGEILTWPAAGKLFAYEDTSFEFSDAPDGTYYFTWQLRVFGVTVGDPVTVTLQVGPVVHGTSGAVSAYAATLSGTAERSVSYQIHSASGALLASGAQLAGSAARAGSPTIHTVVASLMAGNAAVIASALRSVPGDANFTQAQLDYLLAYIQEHLMVPTTDQIAAAVVSALQGTTIPANIKQVNDVTVQGAGTKLNPWQPV